MLRLVCYSGHVSAPQLDRPQNAVTFFAAKPTSNNWEDFLRPTDIKFRDTYLAGFGLSRRVATFFNELDLEVLGQTAIHFGHAHQYACHDKRFERLLLLKP